jgi:O-antigen/teichoic acid export membrane protein
MNRLAGLIKRHRHVNWTLADQAVVSGSNFITGILLARFLGPESFGMFVLLQSIVLYFNSFQSALIFQPMMSAAPQMAELQRANYLHGVFALQLMLCGVLSLLVVMITTVIYTFNFHIHLGIDTNIIAATIAALLAFQLQDWQRRYYFVQEKPSSAFLIDTISYGGQVTLLGICYLNNVLNVATAFWIIAGASFAAFAVGFARDSLSPVFLHAQKVLKEGWRTGRDYLVAWQLQWLGTQGVLMFSAGAIGAEPVGGIRAAQNIVGPINIIFLAMENVVPVVAAKRFSQKGITGLLAYLGRITAFGSALLIPVLLTLAIFASPIIEFLYGGSYVAYATLVIWQVVSIFLQFYLRQVFFFLRTVTATGVIIRSGAIMSITAVVIAMLTVEQYQETAVMAALLSGTAAGLIYAFSAALKITRKLQHNTTLVTNSSVDIDSLMGMEIKS